VTPTDTAPAEAEPALAEQAVATDAGPVAADAATLPATPAPLDEVCAAAVELARAAAAEVAEGGLGEHLGVEAEDEHVVTHSFAATLPGYRGWRWAVTVARAADSDAVTVDEVVLLPGSEALVAPAWVPWSERVRPGDLATGDVLPPAADDARLVPAYADDDLDLADEVFWELGLGRPRVLSQEGRELAAERWEDGETGPYAPRAKAAPGQCGDCGFLVPLAGSLRQGYGACANAMAPDDGRVVSLRYGCGAHSETVIEAQHAATAGMAIEEDELELVPSDGPATPTEVEVEVESV
jgi:Protein of unknown function (DUF3027)